MKKITIYHNPKCSKSRKTLELIKDYPLQLVIVEYLKAALNLEQLKELKAHFALNDFVRTNEPLFKELKLSLNDEQSILNAMVKTPILMQRPIVIYEGQAIIARPPEKVLKLIESFA